MFGKTKERIAKPAKNVATLAVLSLVIALVTLFMCAAFVIGQGA